MNQKNIEINTQDYQKGFRNGYLEGTRIYMEAETKREQLKTEPDPIIMPKGSFLIGCDFGDGSDWTATR